MAQTEVGRVGATGLGKGSEADHLHYEQRVGGVPRPLVIEREVWTTGDDPTRDDIRDDHDDVAGHPGITHVSRNCAPVIDPVTRGPVTPSPVLGGHWMSPVGSATIGPRPTLVAWPSSTLEDVAVSQVDFHATWLGGSGPLCTATEGDSAGLWGCEASTSLRLACRRARSGLTFDVFDDAGDVARAAGGVQQVGFVMPPADPQAYLKAGIPESIRGSCRKRPDDRAIPGTIAAFNCKPDSSRIEEMAYYLMRPADARQTFSDRMDENHVRQGGDCAAGKAGIESEGKSLSLACYRDDQSRANLRFATSATCPAVYWAVLSSNRKGDIAQLVEAYEDAVAGPWVDPGLGGNDAPGCAGPLQTIAAPRAPTRVRVGPVRNGVVGTWIGPDFGVPSATATAT